MAREDPSWGYETYYVLFFLHLESRRICLVGLIQHPDQEWMEQMARNVIFGSILIFGLPFPQVRSPYNADSRWLSSSNVFNPSSASLLLYPPGQLVDWFLQLAPTLLSWQRICFCASSWLFTRNVRPGQDAARMLPVSHSPCGLACLIGRTH